MLTLLSILPSCSASPAPLAVLAIEARAMGGLHPRCDFVSSIVSSPMSRIVSSARSEHEGGRS